MGKRKRKEKGVSQHILTDETGSRQRHFFGSITSRARAAANASSA
jgi:hypothetical protein